MTSSGDNVWCPDVTHDIAPVEPPALQQHDAVLGSADSLLSAQFNEVYGPGDGECYLANECPEAVFEGGVAWCNGYHSCQKAQLRDGNGACYGAESCAESTFSTHTQCSGKGSCKSAQYTGEEYFSMACMAQVHYLISKLKSFESVEITSFSPCFHSKHVDMMLKT